MYKRKGMLVPHETKKTKDPLISSVGSYNVHNSLGKGGRGQVFYATHNTTGEPVVSIFFQFACFPFAAYFPFLVLWYSLRTHLPDHTSLFLLFHFLVLGHQTNRQKEARFLGCCGGVYYPRRL